MADAVDFVESARCVARTFLGEKQLKALNSKLSVRWGKLNSLSAALQLMQAHGVKLDAGEEEELSVMEEAQQISTLVGKMPTQTNDEFQQFFLQLQLLVSTATSLRQALEDGHVEQVERCLEDAEATGISQYILRVALVQAGTQLVSCHDGMKQFVHEADGKMGRLVRGQQDCTAAQKKLAVSQSQLMKKGRNMIGTLAPCILGFVRRGDRALLHMVFQGWLMTHQKDMLHNQLSQEYSARFAHLQDNMVRWKAKMSSGATTMMKGFVAEANGSVAQDIFAAWRNATLATKSERHLADEASSLQAKMSAMGAAQAASARGVLTGMMASMEGTLAEMCLHTWVAATRESKAGGVTQQAMSDFQGRTATLTEEKLGSVKFLLSTFMESLDEGAAISFFKAWTEVLREAKMEAKLAENLAAKASNVTAWTGRRKETSSCAMERAAMHMQEMLLLRILSSWRLHTRLERSMRAHQAMIDAKRQQLAGVQHMFRDFAGQLEKAAGGKDTSRDIFDAKVKSRADRDRQQPSKEKGLSKSEHTVSLPDIKLSSRPGSRGGARPATPVKTNPAPAQACS